MMHHPDGGLISSLKSWPLDEIIPQNLFHPWAYELRCFRVGEENVRYIDDRSVQRRGTLLITLFADLADVVCL